MECRYVCALRMKVARNVIVMDMEMVCGISVMQRRVNVIVFITLVANTATSVPMDITAIHGTLRSIIELFETNFCNMSYTQH